MYLAYNYTCTCSYNYTCTCSLPAIVHVPCLQLYMYMFLACNCTCTCSYNCICTCTLPTIVHVHVPCLQLYMYMKLSLYMYTMYMYLAYNYTVALENISLLIQYGCTNRVSQALFILITYSLIIFITN